jgi:putative FmdB family regulatory protein
MPLYEYECTSCHRRTEKIQKYSDADLTVCPHCGGPLERTITAAAMVFKGGGWYKDGYASVKHDAPSGNSDMSASASSSDAGSSDGGSSGAGSSASGDSNAGSSGDSAKIVTTPSAPAAAVPAATAKA